LAAAAAINRSTAASAFGEGRGGGRSRGEPETVVPSPIPEEPPPPGIRPLRRTNTMPEIATVEDVEDESNMPVDKSNAPWRAIEWNPE